MLKRLVLAILLAAPAAAADIPCIYALIPQETVISYGGGSGVVDISAPAGCEWFAFTRTPWIHLPHGNFGNSYGVLEYSVDPNPTNEQRSGEITIAGKTFTVTQTGVGTSLPAAYIYPAAALVRGVNSTFWVTQINVYNPYDIPIRAHLEFLPRQGGTDTASFWAWIYPKAVYDDPDIVATLFGDADEHVGWIRVSWQNTVLPPVVTGKIWTPDANGGSFAQAIRPALDTDVFYSAGVPGVILSSGYRTNIGIVNPGPAASTVLLTIYGEDGTEAGTHQYDVDPGRALQVRLDADIPLSHPFRGSAMLDVVCGSAVIGYASVIDNRTGDPIYVEALRK